MWTFELFYRTKLGDVLDGTDSLTKEEVLEFAERYGAPRAALDLLNELDEEEVYEDVRDIWPDMPTSDDEIGWRNDE